MMFTSRDNEDEDPMVRLIQLALVYHASTSAYPYCACNVVYHKRLFREDALTPIYCIEHHEERSDTA